MKDIEWFDKEEVKRCCKIKDTTYKMRLRKVPAKNKRLAKTERNSKLRLKRYSHITMIYKCFCPNGEPQVDNMKFLTAYLYSIDWNYFCNIIPGNCSPFDIKKKMEYLYKQLKKSDPSTLILSSTEKNPNDRYYHANFLIKTTLKRTEIQEYLNIVSEEKNFSATRYKIEEYNWSYGLDGVDYTLKDPTDGFLLNDKSIYPQSIYQSLN